MAHHKSAFKRIRKSEKSRLYNRLRKKNMKKAIRSVREAESYENAADNLKRVTKILDKLASKRIIHKNNASNYKSKLAKLVNKMKTQKEEV